MACIDEGATVNPEQVAVGDLDGNGSADIAAVLVTHPDGSGMFSTLRARTVVQRHTRRKGDCPLLP